MSKLFTISGIIIKRANYRDTDRWLTVFSQEKGKIKLLAKGIRKISSKRSGKLELFNQVKLQVVAGRTFNIAAEVELINSFPKFRHNLSLISSVYQLTEVIDVLTPEESPRENIYELLLLFLTHAESDTPEALQGRLLKFQQALLVRLGFWDGLSSQEKFSNPVFVRSFIENIIEKRLKSPDVLK
jgi:DNA repair protein RecO (recombination protein O)